MQLVQFEWSYNSRSVWVSEELSVKPWSMLASRKQTFGQIRAVIAAGLFIRAFGAHNRFEMPWSVAEELRRFIIHCRGALDARVRWAPHTFITMLPTSHQGLYTADPGVERVGWDRPQRPKS